MEFKAWLLLLLYTVLVGCATEIPPVVSKPIIHPPPPVRLAQVQLTALAPYGKHVLTVDPAPPVIPNMPDEPAMDELPYPPVLPIKVVTHHPELSISEMIWNRFCKGLHLSEQERDILFSTEQPTSLLDRCPPYPPVDEK